MDIKEHRHNAVIGYYWRSQRVVSLIGKALGSYPRLSRIVAEATHQGKAVQNDQLYSVMQWHLMERGYGVLTPMSAQHLKRVEKTAQTTMHRM